MAYPIESKLVVAVSSSALFNLEEEDKIFNEKGIDEYRSFQLKNYRVVLKKGLAFPFIRRLLHLNDIFTKERPVEVVILSRNSPETGLRVSNSISSYNLEISRFAFTAGENPFKYMPAYNVSLFLSTNPKDVQEAINSNQPAGVILNSNISDDTSDNQLRVAFDFDSVLADDTSEKVYQDVNGQLELYFGNEKQHSNDPLPAGPLNNFFLQLSRIQELEKKMLLKNPSNKRIIQTSIITARNAPADQRAINTLISWNVDVDNMFLLGGISKKNILEILKPHIFFDDQKAHLDCSIENVPMVHIPFGIANIISK